MDYDFIIIGGGIAGVYCAYKLLLSSSKYKILLLEKESQLGGRVTMKKWHDVDLKLGAGIGSPENHVLIKLMEELSFPYIKSKSEIGFINSNDKFDQLKFTKQIKDKVQEYKTLKTAFTALNIK